MEQDVNGGVYKPNNLSLYTYTFNNPVKHVDPSGEVAETLWDVANIGIGVASLADNVSEGSWGWAAVDLVGLAYDVVATAVPFLPGGASAGVKAYRAGNAVADSINVGADVATAMKESHRAAKAADTTANAATEGTRIHREVGQALDSSDSLSDGARNFFPGSNGSHGPQPDISWNNAPGVWGDLTTPGSWASHERKYNSTFGKGVPMLYERGVGIVNSPMLRSGAGTALFGVEQGSQYLIGGTE